LRLTLRVLASAVVVALAVGSVPCSARADGDPASDVLVTQTLFLPFDAGISARQQAQLAALMQAAARRGYQLRVALIASPTDLGSVTELWRRPQSYAEFLGEELSLVYRGTLLVIMPNGFGLYRLDGPLAGARSALAGVSAPGTGAGLGASALAAIRRLAAAAGHPLPLLNAPTAVASTPGSPRALPWIVFAVGGLLVAVAWALSLRAQPLNARAGPILSVRRIFSG
jgi:hypothetical protein